MTDERFLAIAAHLVIPFAIGFVCGRAIRRRASLVAALIAWLGYLCFNLYISATSPDKEIMQGAVIGFQLTVGTAVTLFAMASSVATQRFARPAP